MAIITFWSNGKEQVGKTLSTVAVATNMSIEHNKKIIIISTSYKDSTLLNCYYNLSRTEQKKIFKSSSKSVELGSGIQGLYRIMKSGKISPDIITDYTKVVFKDRLELLANTEVSAKVSDEDKEIIQNYYEIIKLANQYYDYVFVDLDNSIGGQQISQILNESSIIVEVFSQRMTKINKLIDVRARNPVLAGKNAMLLIAKYDKNSKYKAENLKRIMKLKKEINVIPYDTLFFEAAEEGMVPDLFLRLRALNDKTDSHSVFVQEIIKTTENIIVTDQELQLNIR